MARRHRSEHESISSSSMLDVLTNVVGILIIFLVVTIVQLEPSGGPSVDVAELPDATTEQLAHEEERLAGLEAERSALWDRWKALEAGAGSLRGRGEAVAAQLAELGPPRPTTAELRSRHGEAETEAESLDRQLRKLNDAIRALEQDKEHLRHQIVSAPAPLRLRLPVQRETAADQTPAIVVCRYGRLFVLDTEVLAERFTAAFDRVVATNRTYTAHTFARYFRANDVGDAWFRLELEAMGDSRVKIIFTPRRDRGESIDQATREGSAFRRWVRTVNPSTQYVLFRVYMDSLDAYVQARRIVEDMHSDGGQAARHVQVGIGWIPYDHGERIFEVIPPLREGQRSDGPVFGPDN